MANTWGDIIARNYSAGRAIGNDFSESRFSRRAQKLKDDYEARAAAEGKNLEDYLPEGMPAQQWYEPTDRGLEQKIAEKLAFLRQLDDEFKRGK